MAGTRERFFFNYELPRIKTNYFLRARERWAGMEMKNRRQIR